MVKATNFLANGPDQWIRKGELPQACTIAGLIAAIFIIDLWTPKGISVWALYIIPLLLTIRPASSRLPLLGASVCTGLAVAGYLLSPTIIPSWMSVANRTIGILVLWIVALLLARHKQTEAGLKSSETRFRQMAETVQEVFWMATPDVVTTTYISPAYERIWGRSRESLAENPASWLDAVHPDDREQVLATLTRYRDEEAAMEYRIVRPDGSVRWVWDHGCPVRNDHGEISGIVGFAMDITERKRSEAEREGLIARLEEALANVKTLHGLLSICSGCQKVCDDKGSWKDVRHHSEADFHHALCPPCAETLFPGFYQRWKHTH
jgi:PAS domain S-box-containing protein